MVEKSESGIRTQSKGNSNAPEIPWSMAILPVAVLILLLAANVFFYGSDSSFGPNQIALLFATAVASTIGFLLNVPSRVMIEGVRSSIASALVAMLILLLIGALTGTWMISGIVPAMIYYGLDIFSPQFFLFATAIVCAVVSVVTGSSWSTVATVGIALLGIGKTMGIHEGLIAGAIISGAYFGDKISPLSDTTNLAAAMAGAELITHIRYMLWTTVPSITIALLIYLSIGMAMEPAESVSDSAALKMEIEKHFQLSPWLLLVPLVVLGMIVMRFEAIVALFVGAVVGGLLAIAFQPSVVKSISNLEPIAVKDSNGDETGEYRERHYLEHSYCAMFNSMALETQIIAESEIEQREKSLAELTSNDAESHKDEIGEIKAALGASELLRGKGMQGMLNTIWLIITAMCFGGVMESTGLLRRLTQPLVSLAKSTGSLVATTAGSCMFVNLTASDQYLAIVVPGRMFRESYRERGLAPENLSRTLEDSGTVTSVLIPWNTCGATQSNVLSVEVLVYAPFCFFNIISPIMTVLVAMLAIRIAPLAASESASEVELG